MVASDCCRLTIWSAAPTPRSVRGTLASAASRYGHGCPASASRASSARCVEEALPDHAGSEPRLAPRRLDFFLQKAVRLAPHISGTCIGPGAAFIVGAAGGLADLVTLAALELKTAVVAAGAINRGFDRAVARFDHAG